MILRYRPLGDWPDGELTPEESRVSPQFSALWSDTLGLLEREVEMLAGVGADCVLEVAASARDVRVDGSLRVDARPSHPGVVISFESKAHGPLRYWTDRYTTGRVWARRGEIDVHTGKPRGVTVTVPGWQANVRAVALGLEALRAIERYGIANRGEQYTGWKQLGAGTPLGPPAPMTVDEAARILLVGADVAATPAMVADLVDGTDLPFVSTLYRLAARTHHPDAGGDPDVFRKITEARDLLATSLTKAG